MKKLLFGFCLFFVIQNSHATSVDAKIIQIRVDKSGVGMITFDKPLQGTSPSCINPYYNNALSFDANSAGGKSILAVALAAKAQNVSVVAYGLGACTIYGGAHVEDLDYMVSR